MKEVNKWFGDFQVLKDINLDVKEKQKIVVCGPSGSGKSTLIRCINRLEEHQKGTIIVDGTELTEETKNMINYKKIKLMKKNAIIINTSRGGIINEIDLDKTLKNNMIFGAGLDVFEKEPIDKNNPLINNEKVLLSPHSATFTNECKSRMAIETTKNIIDFFENKLDKSMIVKI